VANRLPQVEDHLEVIHLENLDLEDHLEVIHLEDHLEVVPLAVVVLHLIKLHLKIYETFSFILYSQKRLKCII
jgi:hypothetical protein